MESLGKMRLPWSVRPHCAAVLAVQARCVRIVHIIARLNDGGPARVVAHLVNMMSALGHESVVLAGEVQEGEPDLAPALVRDGITIERVAGLGRRLDLRADFSAYFRLRMRLQQLRPDLVHTHTAKAGALGRLACRGLRIPCVHTYHGHVLRGYFGAWGNAVVRVAERILAGPYHHHALTASQCHELAVEANIGHRSRWHCLPPPVAAVTGAVADWHARLTGGGIVIGFLGRLASVKDADLFLATIVELRRTHRVQALICGEGAERARLERVADSLALPVLFTGQVPAAEALGAMDLLLITSRNEGLPLTVVEAGCAGVPVVAPAVGGLADLVHAGIIEVGSRDAAGLAAACRRMLDDSALRSQRLAIAAAYATRLRPSALAGRYQAMYRRACHDSR